jgi:predicted DNA repair protein MutK
MEALVLAVVGIGITAGVYGVVALIVKADDAGLALARSQLAPPVGSLLRGLGRGLVMGMPWLLAGLAGIGTAAMIWVGGGIVLHGLESFGLHAPAEFIHHLQERAEHSVSDGLGGLVGWAAGAAGSGVFGIIIGAIAIPLAHRLAPLTGWLQVKLARRRAGPAR